VRVFKRVGCPVSEALAHLKAKQPAVEAIRVLGRWRQLGAGHAVFGAGCSCGIQATSVRVHDFEQDILGFLRGKHGEAARAASIADLLGAMARQKGRAREALALLADLERSLDSFGALHRGGSS
jgi:hypothetical protein